MDKNHLSIPMRLAAYRKTDEPEPDTDGGTAGGYPEPLQ